MKDVLPFLIDKINRGRALDFLTNLLADFSIREVGDHYVVEIDLSPYSIRVRSETINFFRTL